MSCLRSERLKSFKEEERQSEGTPSSLAATPHFFLTSKPPQVPPPIRGFPKHINPSNALPRGNTMAKNSQGLQKGLESFNEGKNPSALVQRPSSPESSPARGNDAAPMPCSTPSPGPEHPSPFLSLETTRPCPSPRSCPHAWTSACGPPRGGCCRSSAPRPCWGRRRQ